MYVCVYVCTLHVSSVRFSPSSLSMPTYCLLARLTCCHLSQIKRDREENGAVYWHRCLSYLLLSSSLGSPTCCWHPLPLIPQAPASTNQTLMYKSTSRQQRSVIIELVLVGRETQGCAHVGTHTAEAHLRLSVPKLGLAPLCHSETPLPADERQVEGRCTRPAIRPR